MKTLTLYRGASSHEIRGSMFFSSDPDFAADYGDVEHYAVTIPENVFDSLNPDHVRPLLPLVDPYDNEEVTTIEEYFSRSSDTWEMIEAIVDYIPNPVLIVTEGGVVNYFVKDKELITRLEKPSPTP